MTHPFKLINARRLRREYRADIRIGTRATGYAIVGHVERAESSKMLGYRAGQYRAIINHMTVATGRTLTDLREELAAHFEEEA